MSVVCEHVSASGDRKHRRDGGGLGPERLPSCAARGPPQLIRTVDVGDRRPAGVPLMLLAAIIAAGTLRMGRSVTGAVLAGLVAVAQPWTLPGGGSNLVPDGLTYAALVGAVLAASVGVTSSTRRARNWWLVMALARLVLASLTKQTGAAGFVLLPIVVRNGPARPRRWQIVAALVIEGVGVFVALVVANGVPEVVPLGLPRTFVDRMRAEVFPGSPAIAVAAAISLLLVAWEVARATQPLPLAGLTVTAAAVAIGACRCAMLGCSPTDSRSSSVRLSRRRRADDEHAPLGSYSGRSWSCPWSRVPTPGLRRERGDGAGLGQ
jgi:hypothetical protein